MYFYLLYNYNKILYVNIFVYFCTVIKEIEIIKGVHPGFVLERLLKEKKIKKGQLALSIMEYPQTITTITK